MSHQDTYTHNEKYAEFLANWDANFYAKYADALKPRGLRSKWRNWRRLCEKRLAMLVTPERVRFDRMTPIFKEPFEPDDEAIIATNGLEIAFFLERNDCEIVHVACTDRYVFKPLDFLLNATPLRYLMLNGFVVARKK